MLKHAKELKTNETEYAWTGQNQERTGWRKGGYGTSVHNWAQYCNC